MIHSNFEGNVHPLYFQHQGHSRTIIGVEEEADGQTCLLIFDPAKRIEWEMILCKLGNESLDSEVKKDLILEMSIRIRAEDLTSSQYQLLYPVGLFYNEAERERSKLIKSSRVP